MQLMKRASARARGFFMVAPEWASIGAVEGGGNFEGLLMAVFSPRGYAAVSRANGGGKCTNDLAALGKNHQLPVAAMALVWVSFAFAGIGEQIAILSPI